MITIDTIGAWLDSPVGGAELTTYLIFAIILIWTGRALP
jgi:hypothetical protein